MKDFGGSNSNDNISDLGSLRQRRTYSALAQIEAYWESLRGTRLMPQRSEIDPRGLKGALEHCFILERIAPGIARLRVAGSHLADLLGMEVRGMPITALLTGDSRRALSDAMEEIFETPACATIELEAETSFGRPAMKARMVMMPVRSDLGDTSRLLGGLVADGEIGRAPRRFKITRIDLRPLVKPDALQPADHPFVKAGLEAEEKASKREITVTRAAQQPVRMPEALDTASGSADNQRFEQVLPGVPYLRVVRT